MHIISRRSISVGLRIRDVSVTLLTAASIFLVGCGTTTLDSATSQIGPNSRDADSLLIVDCLLPGQVRRLGRSITYLTSRRPIKASTSECEIRGGEYVAFDRANFATSLKIWLPEAQAGDPDAQTNVGEIYEKGLGLQADAVLAAQWYQKAADQGHSRARINLGYLYESGIGVEKDLVKAMNLYRMASGFNEGDLEYVTAFEVATRKQQVVDLQRQEQEIADLKETVALLQQKNIDLEQRQAQLKTQQLKVKEQRQFVLTQRAATAAVQDDVNSTQSELVASLAQVDELQTSLTASENEKTDLVKQLQEQQSLTEKLQSAYNESSGELRLARQELSEQEKILASLQQKVTNASNLSHSPELLDVEDRLAAAEDEFDATMLAAEASQRALAQESKLLQVQISNAKARESALQTELSRVVEDLSGAELSSARLEIQLKSQVEDHRKQVQQMRRQLSLSAQELLAVQSRLEETQGIVAGADRQQLAIQSELIEKRQNSEMEIAALENQIARARAREINYRGELERLSGNLANAELNSIESQAALEKKVDTQQSELRALQSQLAESESAREAINERLDNTLADVASKSVELDAIRDQLVTQKTAYDEQIAAAFDIEQSLSLELQRLGDALARDQLDKATLERQLNEQLNAAKQQNAQMAEQLVRYAQEIDNVKLSLEKSSSNYGDQSDELLQLRDRLVEQQKSLDMQKNVTDHREDQLLAEIERLSLQAAEADIQNRFLTAEIADQKIDIEELTARYEAAASDLSKSDGKLGKQQELIGQLSDELQRVRFDSLSQLSSTRAELNQNKAALQEAQTLVQELSVEADRLRSQQSSGSKELEAQLLAASQVEQSLKQQLEEADDESDTLRQRLVDQEQKYRYELAAAKGQLQLVRDESSESLLQLAELESQVAEQQALISTQESEINELQTVVTRTKASAAKNPGQFIQPVLNAGPAISIIEPEMLVTRGGPALKAEGGADAQVEVIGSVQPSDNILSFKIEGRSVPLNDNGVFTYMANSADTDLRMFAIDDAGGRTDLEVKFSQTRGVASRNESSVDLSGVEFGSYHALIIGNNNFDSLQNLKTAETDAITVENLLREKYGFKTKLLLDATRYDILSALNDMRETLTDEDNLLIYYAGHGEIANSTGYWLPVDAEPDNDANWIANSTITKYVETMNAKHVIVVADSCYSGTLTRTSLSRLSTGLTSQQQKKWYETVAESKVRTVFTSGGVKPVLDSVGGSRHSVFSSAFIDELESSSSQVVSTYKLFLRVQERVKAEAARIGVDQNPQYSPMQFAGHESGEFLFLVGGKSDSASLDIDPNGQLQYMQKLAANNTNYESEGL